jgi:DNA-binding transcriptional MerR regulator
MVGYGSPEVCRLTGLKFPTLDAWDRRGFLHPSVQKGTGHDSMTRLWSFRDLVAIRAAVKLRHAGVSLQSLRKVVAHLKARKGLDSATEALAGTYLLTDGKRVLEVEGDAVLEALSGQGCMFVLPLGAVVAELRRDIARLEAAA